MRQDVIKIRSLVGVGNFVGPDVIIKNMSNITSEIVESFKASEFASAFDFNFSPYQKNAHIK